MPIYLCKPGYGELEPWRHGVQVYSYPFSIDDIPTSGSLSKVDNGTTAFTGGSVVSPKSHTTAESPENQLNNANENATAATTVAIATSSRAIRRIRHAEIVLVDDVCVAYGRYWLRLRWPGKQGGFAGYIALGLLPPSWNSQNTMENDSKPLCVRTGLVFPSSSAMELLPSYHDGLSNVASNCGTEPVFCRICREGLHDVEDEQPTNNGINDEQQHTLEEAAADPVGCREDQQDSDVLEGTKKESTVSSQGPTLPVQYHPNTYAAENPVLAPCECSGSMAFVHYLCVEQWRCRSRHPEARNGLNCETCGALYALPAPTSRPSHGGHGLQGPGNLAGFVAEEDWLEAMPEHVLAALRQPRPWWQIVAAAVRQRWLRPFAPVVMSPLVAMYCRARRLLKKLGVSRRRWACSLCGRRARWKCVRCLRSYYCSRQCQNVSWHIVHKHMCYKPSRFWCSVIIYTSIAVLAFPGILQNPLVYDLVLSLVPASFIIMGILGGGVATTFKNLLGIDIRGRKLEFAVVLLTMWLTLVSAGLVWAFFGDVGSCYGFFGKWYQYRDTNKEFATDRNWILSTVTRFILHPAHSWFRVWDRAAASSAPWLRMRMCTTNPSGEIAVKKDAFCFGKFAEANPEFYFVEEGGEKCASDLILVSSLWIAAGVIFAFSTILKKRERNRRHAARQRPRAGHQVLLEPRPHQE